MGNFSEFVKMDKSNNDIKKEGIKNEYDKDTLEELINSYSNLSNDQLINEFIKMTLEKKKKGELNAMQLDSLKNTLLPFLNKEQTNKLDELLSLVKNV